MISVLVVDDDRTVRETLADFFETLGYAARTAGTATEGRQAAAQHAGVFPNYYIGILQSAELTGRLDESLESLAHYLEREIDTRAKVVGALAYPGVVMIMSFFTVLVLAGYVLR